MSSAWKCRKRREDLFLSKKFFAMFTYILKKREIIRAQEILPGLLLKFAKFTIIQGG
jgi:hypothetical protein